MGIKLTPFRVFLITDGPKEDSTFTFYCLFLHPFFFSGQSILLHPWKHDQRGVSVGAGVGWTYEPTPPPAVWLAAGA